MTNRRRHITRTVVSLIVLSLFASPFLAQEQKKREFGSSLNELKWDPTRKTGVQPSQTKQQSDELDEGDVIRVDSTLVVCDVLVADKQGRGIDGLTRDDFVITDDDDLKEVATFARGDDPNKLRSIILLIDHSGSQLRYIEKSVKAAKILVANLRPKDEMAIVTDDIELLVDYTSDRKRLTKALDKLKEKADDHILGKSLQYSALMATLQELVAGRQRPIIIFQTDGDELNHLRSGATPAATGGFREFSLVDVINAAERGRVTIYTVIPNVQFLGLSKEEQQKILQDRLPESIAPSESVDRMNWIITGHVREQMALEGLSKLSGGWTEFLEKPEDASRIYDRILTDINHRYILGIQPESDVRDGKRHRLKIEVKNHPEYIVWGRKFYYF